MCAFVGAPTRMMMPAIAIVAPTSPRSLEPLDSVSNCEKQRDQGTDPMITAATPEDSDTKAR